MKEELEQLYIHSINNDVAPNVFAQEVLDLFSVVKRFKATFDNEGTKDIEEYFWAENKDEAFNKVFAKYPKAEFVMI